MFKQALFRLMSYQLDCMVDELEIIDENLSSSKFEDVEISSLFNKLIIDINECSANLEKLDHLINLNIQ